MADILNMIRQIRIFFSYMILWIVDYFGPQLYRVGIGLQRENQRNQIQQVCPSEVVEL